MRLISPRRFWNAWGMVFLPSLFVFYSLPLLFPWMSVRAGAENTPIPRTILGLYDSTEDYNRQADNNLIHNNAEMVLNYLGMKVKLYDVAQGIPGDDVMKDVCGILTWFQDEEVSDAANFWAWMTRQVQSGKKLVMLKTSSAYKDKKTGVAIPFEVIEKLYTSMGLLYSGDWTDNPLVIELIDKDSGMVEFERTLDDELEAYEKIVPVNPQDKVYLKLRRTDIEDGDSATVVVTPQGGVALGDYVLLINYLNDRFRWRINPFRFFEEAFALKAKPRFDTTTLLGRRILYVHIDGDGLRNTSEIDPQRVSGEMIRDEILDVYPLPTTVSFIACEVDSRYFGSKKLEGLAKAIYEKAYVEAGSHGFSHPLDWDKALTAFEIDGYSKKMMVGDLNIASESLYGNAAKVIVDRSVYLKRETQGAIEYLNQNVMPEGKKVAVYQWTGNCRPPAEAIDLVNQIGVKNINGGDSRLDDAIPSYTGIAALVRQTEGRLQTYTSNSNENIYTEGWTTAYGGLTNIIETFKQTEVPTLVDAVPRRVSPMNIYYHFYSGEKRASLNALKKVYEYALEQKVIPVFTSEYISGVEGFLQGEILDLGDGGWRFSRYGSCRTVRFDQTGIYPDLEKSKGVIGFSYWFDHLYLYLGDLGEAEVYLTEKPPRLPYLAEAANLMNELALSQNSITFKTRGFKDGFYRFVNMWPHAKYGVKIRAWDDDKLLYHAEAKSNRKGELEVRIPLEGWAKVEITKW